MILRCQILRDLNVDVANIVLEKFGSITVIQHSCAVSQVRVSLNHWYLSYDISSCFALKYPD